MRRLELHNPAFADKPRAHNLGYNLNSRNMQNSVLIEYEEACFVGFCISSFQGNLSARAINGDLNGPNFAYRLRIYHSHGEHRHLVCFGSSRSGYG